MKTELTAALCASSNVRKLFSVYLISYSFFITNTICSTSFSKISVSKQMLRGAHCTDHKHLSNSKYDEPNVSEMSNTESMQGHMLLLHSKDGTVFSVIRWVTEDIAFIDKKKWSFVQFCDKIQSILDCVDSGSSFNLNSRNYTRVAIEKMKEKSDIVFE